MTNREIGWMACLALGAVALLLALVAAGPERGGGGGRLAGRAAPERGEEGPPRSAPMEGPATAQGHEPAAPAPERRPDGVVEERGVVVPDADELVTDWLRRVLPERYGERAEAELMALGELDLRGAELSDADLALLAGLPHLRRLSLRGTALTDAGLGHLGRLGNLEFLDLRGTAVTGERLFQLPTARLEALHLTDTHVRGEDLRRLPPMPSLRTLKLNFLELGDADLDALAIYPQLRHLELDQTRLTADGLRLLLEQHPSLERVELRGTNVDSNALPALAALLPGCELVADSGHPVWVGR